MLVSIELEKRSLYLLKNIDYRKAATISIDDFYLTAKNQVIFCGLYDS